MIGAFIAWESDILPRKKNPPGYVIAENGCHLWVGAKANGYGVARWQGRQQPVHRVRYEREIGPIPEGLELDHFVCDDRGCCNPRHVRPVTHRENGLRSQSAAATNTAKTHCPYGHPYTWDDRTVQGARLCRVCRLRRSRERYAREKKNGTRQKPSPEARERANARRRNPEYRAKERARRARK